MTRNDDDDDNEKDNKNINNWGDAMLESPTSSVI